MARTPKNLSLATLVAITLTACSQSEPDVDAPSTASDSSLAATLGRGSEHALLEAMIESTGLSQALDATGPYTLFAPPDDTLDAASGDADLADPTMKAQAAQLLRAHIVPGALTRSDIGTAVDRAGSEGAQMRTMTDAVLTFSRDGDRLMVRGPEGSAVVLSGNETLATNGVIQPISGLLLAPPTGAEEG